MPTSRLSNIAVIASLTFGLTLSPVPAHAKPKDGQKTQKQQTSERASLKAPEKGNAEAKVPAAAAAAPAAAPAAPVVAPAANAAGQKPPADGSKKTTDTKLFDTDFSNAPTNISSDSLTLKNDKRVFVYTGNVIVTQANMTLTADELEGTYTEKNQIDKLYAKKNVVITKTGETPDELVKATAQHAVFDNKTQIATLTKNPQVEQNGSILTADVIKMYLEEDRSVAEGQVRVTLVQKAEKDGRPVPPGTTPVPGQEAPRKRKGLLGNK